MATASVSRRSRTPPSSPRSTVSTRSCSARRPSPTRRSPQLFFDRGIAVLCEKPLAIDRHRGPPDGRGGRARPASPFTMATKFRFCDDVIRAEAARTPGALGEIRLLENAFTSRVDMSDALEHRPRDQRRRRAHRQRHPLGRPGAATSSARSREVLAVETSRPAGSRSTTRPGCSCVTTPAPTATVDLSWSIDKSLADFLRLYGTDGRGPGRLARVGVAPLRRRLGGLRHGLRQGSGDGRGARRLLPRRAGRGPARGHDRGRPGGVGRRSTPRTCRSRAAAGSSSAELDA